MLACAALVLLVVFIYAQVHSHAFIHYDDPEYVSRNAHVLNGLTWSGIQWAFTSVHAAYWHPVTWMSHMLDVSLFGQNAGRHLLVNVLLHAANAVLLFLWLQAMTGAFWRSSIVAALFAAHPLHVESVAWVAERKDVLSALFMLLALHGYTRWVRARSKPAYAASIVAFILGLLSKPMLVTFPFVLLLLDWWPFKRRALIEKIPYFAAIVPIIAITLTTQNVAMAGANVPLSIRLANAAIAYVKYLGKTIWPSSLAIIYPYQLTVSLAAATFCALLLVAITAAVILLRNRAPWLTVGWLWFAGTLVPVIGLVQVGMQSMADRFTYIPHIGLFVAIVWGIGALTERSTEARTLAALASAAAVVALAIVAYVQTGRWTDSITLFEHTIAVTENNKLAHINLGAAYYDAGAHERAEEQYRAAEGFKPADVQHLGLALALTAQGKLDAAYPEAKAAHEANPNNADAASTLGTIELARGNAVAAAPLLERAASLSGDPMVRARLALARGKNDEAQQWFATAAKQTDSADAHLALATELARSGKDAEAAREYDAALRLNPASYDTHMNFGALLSRGGKDEDAVREFSAAAAIRPRSPEPHIYAALAQANRKQLEDAIEHVRRAIEIDHDAASRFLTDAIRRPADPAAIDQYLAFLRQQAGVR